MIAYPSTSGIVATTIMKFDNVKYSVGVTNLAAYKTTGKFLCEKEGLYIISASVMSYTDEATYYIYLNGNNISVTGIADHTGSYFFTGAVTIIQKLRPSDQVWLYAHRSWYLYADLYSKVIIIKIK